VCQHLAVHIWPEDRRTRIASNPQRSSQNGFRIERTQSRSGCSIDAVDAQIHGEPQSDCLRRTGPLSERSSPRPTFNDRALEQSPRQWRRDEDTHAHTTGGFTKDRDATGITAEARNVSPYPCQRRDLIHDAVIARGERSGFRGERRMGEEAERTQPIVQRNDDSTFCGQHGTIVPVFTAEPGKEPTSMDPHHYRAPTVERWRPDVQVEAILGHACLIRIDVGIRLVLYAVVAQRISVTHPGPGCR